MPITTSQVTLSSASPVLLAKNTGVEPADFYITFISGVNSPIYVGGPTVTTSNGFPITPESPWTDTIASVIRLQPNDSIFGILKLPSPMTVGVMLVPIQ